ncbi:hypothetical protein BC938DRAFT_481519, partial [Jimgerdemannia flammicorona]
TRDFSSCEKPPDIRVLFFLHLLLTSYLGFHGYLVERECRNLQLVIQYSWIFWLIMPAWSTAADQDAHGFEELQLSFTLPSHKPPPKQALAARVVNVASESHRLGKIDFDNMNDEWREKGI